MIKKNENDTFHKKRVVVVQRSMYLGTKCMCLGIYYDTLWCILIHCGILWYILNLVILS